MCIVGYLKYAYSYATYYHVYAMAYATVPYYMSWHEVNTVSYRIISYTSQCITL